MVNIVYLHVFYSKWSIRNILSHDHFVLVLSAAGSLRQNWYELVCSLAGESEAVLPAVILVKTRVQTGLLNDELLISCQVSHVSELLERSSCLRNRLLGKVI